MTPMRKLVVPLLCASLFAPSLPAASANALPLVKPGVVPTMALRSPAGAVDPARWASSAPSSPARSSPPPSPSIARATRTWSTAPPTSIPSTGAPAPTSTATGRSASARICAEAFDTKRAEGVGCTTGAFSHFKTPTAHRRSEHSRRNPFMHVCKMALNSARPSHDGRSRCRREGRDGPIAGDCTSA